MDVDFPNIRYQKITIAQAVISGIAREAICRVDRDGVERCYHLETGSFWDVPGSFPAA